MSEAIKPPVEIPAYLVANGIVAKPIGPQWKISPMRDAWVRA